MDGLGGEIAAFLAARGAEAVEARQRAALQIACHMDLNEVMAADADGRAQIVLRLERLIERERLRGARKHWSYDLNRHIALKQILDRLCQANSDYPAKLRRRSQKIERRLSAPF